MADARQQFVTEMAVVDHPSIRGNFTKGSLKRDAIGTHTTNNRMELMAAIEGLNALKRPCAVELFTDSEYLKKGTQSWLPQWKRRGFRTMDGQPVKNQDLWQKLEQAAGRHTVEWKWIRGHAGNPMNELCDRLAKEAMANGLNP
jgi:ribonuclease HI